MALLKNLYLDLSFLNPFKKSPPPKTLPPPRIQTQPFPDISQNYLSKNVITNAQINNSYINSPINKPIPQISKRLLEQNEEKPLELPKIKKPMEPPLFKEEKKEDKNKILEKNIKLETEKVETPKNIDKNSEEKNENISFSETSFFSMLYNHLSQEETYIHHSLPKNILNDNLLEQMQAFWKEKKEELKILEFNKTIKNDLLQRMSELQQLEIEWQKLQHQHDKIKDELAAKEILIEQEIKYLRRNFKKLHMTTNVKPEYAFVLADGKKLNNLQDLVDALKDMPENIFYFHVNESKNDFANWINEVMGLGELSTHIKQCKTKNDILNKIEFWYNTN